MIEFPDAPVIGDRVESVGSSSAGVIGWEWDGAAWLSVYIAPPPTGPVLPPIPPNAPKMVITSIEPPNPDPVSTTLTLRGQLFRNSSPTVNFRGGWWPAVFISDTELQVTLDLAQGAPYTNIKARVTGPLTETNNVSFPVGPQTQPTLHMAVPQAVYTGVPDNYIHLYGEFFTDGLQIAAAGVPQETFFVSPEEMYFVLDTTLHTSGGVYINGTSFGGATSVLVDSNPAP